MSDPTREAPEPESLVSDQSPLLAEGQIRAGRLAGQSLPGAILILAAPVFFEQLLAATVGLVDKMLTGGLPEGATAALDGVGLGSYIGWFIGIAVSSVGIGALAIISRAMGRGDDREAALGLGQAVIFSLAWGALLAVTLYLGAPLLAWMGQLSPEASRACTQYVRTIALAVPFSSLTFIGIMCLHATGEATRPFLVMVAVNVVNIAVSWYLSGSTIHGFGHTLPSPGHLGVIGIAAGTAAARLVGAALILGLLIRGVKDLRLERWALRVELRMLLRIIRVGVPAFIEGIGMWFGNIVVLGIVGRIAILRGMQHGAETGTVVGLMGAHTIAVQWESFSFLPGFALGTAAATLVGQFLGAGNVRRATRSILACAGVAGIFMAGAGVSFCLYGDFLTRQISVDPLHLELVPKLLFICGLVQVNFALSMVIREAIRGAGDTRWAMFITWFGTYALRIPLAYLVGYVWGYGLVGVWWVLCGEIVVRSLLFLGRFLHGGWKRLEV